MAAHSTSHCELRVAHLSTSLTGGAAIAAQRICSAQQEAGLAAHLFTRSRPSPRTFKASRSRSSLIITPQQSLVSRITRSINSARTQPPSILFTPLSSSLSTSAIEKTLGAFDIINVHNAYNFVRLDRLLAARARYRVVVTLHDERSYTSGCHYTLGCDRFCTSCDNCPQSRAPQLLPLRDRQSATRDLLASGRLSFVAPSKWIYNQAVRFGTPEHLVEHIPNPIDTDAFSPARSRSSESLDKFTIGWLPGKLTQPFFDAVRLAQRELTSSGRNVTVHVRTIASAAVPADIPTSTVSNIITEHHRAKFWAGTDVGVSMTEADNFPNVVLESIAVGTPFVINDVGGAGEAVTATNGGIVLSDCAAPTLARALVSMVNERTTWQAAGAIAAAKCTELYDFAAISERYRSHYESMAANN